ncbi:MAG: ferrous iron transport protein A [Solobacterium sp.]|nr:ferrous iron transport protein A [Solobacterium sp.]
MLPLTLAEIGREYTILRIGGNPAVKKHLEDLGFHAGSTVIVVSDIGGNLIVNVKETRIALDKTLASKLFV